MYVCFIIHQKNQIMDYETYTLKTEGAEYSLPDGNVQGALEDIVTFFSDDRERVITDLKFLRDNWFDPLGRDGIFNQDNGQLHSLQKAIHLIVMLEEGIGDGDFG